MLESHAMIPLERVEVECANMEAPPAEIKQRPAAALARVTQSGYYRPSRLERAISSCVVLRWQSP